jgi:hypothetical protein
MSYHLEDIGAVFTCCLFPEMTREAMENILGYYPQISFVVIDDACREHEEELAAIERDFDTTIIRNTERMGTGRSIDRALRELDTQLLLTVDHGVRLKQGGLLEIYLGMMRLNPNWIGVGLKRSDKRCNTAFGPYIDPVFSVWDREFIHDNQDDGLTFALTNIRIEDWQVSGCSTAQFMQYRAIVLGRRQGFIGKAMLERYYRHHRTLRTRGRCASPHELMIVDEDYLSPRVRRPDGSLRYPGKPFDPEKDVLGRPGRRGQDLRREAREKDDEDLGLR